MKVSDYFENKERFEKMIEEFFEYLVKMNLKYITSLVFNTN